MAPAFTFTDRARPFIEIGVGDTRIERSTARWGSARWSDEDARWSGVEPSWLDVSCDVFEARCEYGRARSNERFVPSIATIEVSNESGWADPYATDDVAALTMRPGRAIRFGVDHVTLGHVVLWRGIIDGIVPTYTYASTPGFMDTATLVCLDALGEVNRAKLAGAVETGDGETAPQRIDRTLDAADWPSGKRAFDGSSIPLVAAALNGQVADLLGRAADSAGGAVYGDRNGNIVYRARDWQTFMPGTPVAATIGNVEASDVCPVEWVRPFARRDIATRVIMGRDEATAVTIDDPAGKLLYGVEPFERIDLWTADDEDLTALANRALRVRSYLTAPVVRGVLLDASSGDDALDVMATADPFGPTHYRCRLAVGDRAVFDDDHLVTGLIHELTAERWQTTINLDLAAPYEATAGRWGRGLWGRALWGSVA